MSVNHKIFFDIQSYEEFKRIANEIGGNISREVFGAMPVGSVPGYSCMVAVVDEVIEITARMLDIVWHGGKSPQSFRMEVVEVKSSPLIIIELPRMTEIELPQLPQIMLDFRGSQSTHTTHINARDILLDHIGDRAVRCAVINQYYEHVTTSLKTGYTADEYTVFFDHLALIRPDEYGNWDIDGTAWYTDGTWSVWSQNDEYEQYWQYCSAPTIPESLQ